MDGWVVIIWCVGGYVKAVMRGGTRGYVTEYVKGCEQAQGCIREHQQKMSNNYVSYRPT